MIEYQRAYRLAVLCRATGAMKGIILAWAMIAGSLYATAITFQYLAREWSALINSCIGG